MEYRNLHGTDIDLLAVAFGSVMVALFSAAAVAGPLFVDDTDRAGVRYSGCGKGVAMADIDNDGDLDLYTAIIYNADRLYLNNGRGIFMNATRMSGLFSLVDAHGCVFADFDNDGNIDLFLAAMREGLHTEKEAYRAWGDDKLYLGEGDGHFTDVSQSSGLSYGGHSTGASVADIDNDGDLDLVVAAYGEGSCRLYVNRGEGVFVEEAHERGFVPAKARYYGCNLADMDNDGYPDILLPNIGGEVEIGIRYFHNRGDGTFIEMTEAAGLHDSEHSCSIAIGDYDNDGDLDFFASFSNHLYMNNGDNTFTKVNEVAGLGEVKRDANGRGCAFVDADNDGDLDLYVAGKGTEFFRNNGDGTFTDMGRKSGIRVSMIHGCAFGDIDGDGDMDMYGSNWFRGDRPWSYPGKFVLYRNTTDNDAYLKVRLEGFSSNRSAVGAKLEIYRQGHLGDRRHRLGYREVICGSGTFTCGPLEQHFGLGREKRCDLRVTFPKSGKVIVMEKVGRGQTIHIKELAEGKHEDRITPDGRLFR